MASILECNIFQNQQVPQGVMVLTKIMPDLPVTALNPILKLIFDIILKNPILPKALERLLKKLELNENGDNLFCGLLMLVQAIIRLPPDALKDNDFMQGLKELKFSDECCVEFLTLFQGSKNDLYNHKSRFGSDFFHRLETFNWRIDITLSSNFLAKSLDTVVIFQINLTNGESKTFEVSIAKFHQLRFYVAYILKEIEFLEKKNVFKS